MLTANLFNRLGPKQPLGSLPTPWPANTTPLRELIVAATRSRGHEYGELEIDAHNPDDPETLRWAAGARDALFGVSNDSLTRVSARTLLSSLGKLVRRPSAESLRHFYRLAMMLDVVGVIDGFLTLLKEAKLDTRIVANVARRIASESPDVTSVKLAIAILGVTSDDRDRDLILELGVYEELTLFSAVAISNMLAESESTIWALAQSTRGWGRIQAVRRLANPQNEQIRDWLLKEAHHTAIMAEEIAYFCAVEGGLLQALKESDPDEQLLDGAGELLEALITGGPAEDMDDYADGGEAAQLYIKHVSDRPSSDLRQLLHVRSMQGFEANTDAPWSDRERRGWTASRRWAIRTGAAAFLARPEWRELTEEGLVAENREEFWPAAEAAKVLGIDPWPHYLRRQRELRSGEWYFLMQTDSVERVEQVISLAEEQLDLNLIGSGPSASLGLGLEYADDNALDFILQDLCRFTGVGWRLIEIGLKARTVRGRNMAQKALKGWGEVNWPGDARSRLEAALEVEPDEQVAERTRALLSGKSFD